MKEKELSIGGIMFILITSVPLTIVFYKGFGFTWWGTIIALALFVLIAGRPAEPGGPFIWEKYKGDVK